MAPVFPLDLDRFWLVWCPEKGVPRMRHETFDVAQKEALRLACENPGYKFYVLSTCGVASTQQATWRNL